MTTSNACDGCYNCCKSTVTDDERGSNRTPVFSSDKLANKVIPVVVSKPEKNSIECTYIDGNRCSKYVDRPSVCKWYPFYPVKNLSGYGIAVASAEWCNYGNQILKNVVKGDVETFELAKSTLEDIKSKLTTEELDEWCASIRSNYLLICEIIL